MPVVLDDDAGERRLIYGADGATLRAVKVDATGQLSVTVPSTTIINGQMYAWDGAAWQKVLVESAANPNIRAKLYDGANGASNALLSADAQSGAVYGLVSAARLQGYNGGTWDRLLSDAAKHLYVNQYGVPGVERTTTTNANVGAHALAFSTVPGGKCWNIKSVSVVNLNNPITRAVTLITRAAVNYETYAFPAVAAGVFAGANLDLWLAAGDTFQIVIYGTVAGDDLQTAINYLEVIA